MSWRIRRSRSAFTPASVRVSPVAAASSTLRSTAAQHARPAEEFPQIRTNPSPFQPLANDWPPSSRTHHRVGLHTLRMIQTTNTITRMVPSNPNPSISFSFEDNLCRTPKRPRFRARGRHRRQSLLHDSHQTSCSLEPLRSTCIAGFGLEGSKVSEVTACGQVTAGGQKPEGPSPCGLPIRSDGPSKSAPRIRTHKS
jgi:hypothetical protein